MIESNRKIYIGSDRWRRKDWNNVVYPVNTDEKEQGRLYVYYRINPASAVPSLDDLLLPLQAQVKEVYICVMGELQQQARVAEELMKLRQEKTRLTGGVRR